MYHFFWVCLPIMLGWCLHCRMMRNFVRKIIIRNYDVDRGCLILSCRQRGFQNLYTLEGGISHYLKNEGPVKWTGNLFVFDSRLSLSPSSYKPEATEKEEVSRNNAFARCYICGSQVCELRHRNCANINCNLLFL